MNKLLKADFYRILKSKLFLIVAIIAVGLPLLTVLVYLAVDKILVVSADYTGISGLNMSGRALISESFVLSSNIGIILPIFITIFIAMDVSNGTLRNKIIAGRSRTVIYFSHLISASVISATLALVSALLFMAFTCLVFGYGAPMDGAEVVRLVYFLVTGVLTFCFSACISTAITLCVKSSAPAVIISTLVGMGLSIVSSLVHSADPMLNKQWFCLIPTYTNTQFLAGGVFPAASFWLGVLSYLLFGTVITLVGLVLFKKKDIK